MCIRDSSELGYNYRMSNIVAGVGRGQLLHLEEHIARKQAIYQLSLIHIEMCIRDRSLGSAVRRMARLVSFQVFSASGEASSVDKSLLIDSTLFSPPSSIMEKWHAPSGLE